MQNHSGHRKAGDDGKWLAMPKGPGDRPVYDVIGCSAVPVSKNLAQPSGDTGGTAGARLAPALTPGFSVREGSVALREEVRPSLANRAQLRYPRRRKSRLRCHPVEHVF